MIARLFACLLDCLLTCPLAYLLQARLDHCLGKIRTYLTEAQAIRETLRFMEHEAPTTHSVEFYLSSTIPTVSNSIPSSRVSNERSERAEPSELQSSHLATWDQE